MDYKTCKINVNITKQRITQVNHNMGVYDMVVFNNEVEHRQDSDYVSKDSLNDGKIFAIIQNMSMELDWLRSCVKQIDVTNIGKKHSLIDAVSKAPINNEIDEL